jgi:hypothetical protein
MAATGYTPLSLYYSTTGAAVPVNTNLVNGELAINITDGKLYYKDNTGTVKLLASNANAGGTFTAPVVIEGTTTDAALRITQLGSGNALLVEDSTNPDASPFVIDATGRVVAGNTLAVSFTGGLLPQMEVLGNTNNTSAFGIGSFRADAGSGYSTFLKSRSATIGTLGGSVVSGDGLGTILWNGDDGIAGIQAASISASVDGTPGTNDMPGRLVFSTTADGANTPTERMRIDSAGNVGIGSTPSAGRGLVLGKAITGSTTSRGITSIGAVQSDVTTQASYFATSASTPATSFTLNQLQHFYALQGTIGVGSAVSNQYGFSVDSSLTGATNNYGFYGNIASGANRYNLYMNGTAANYLGGDTIVNGKIGLGTAASPSYGTAGQVLTSAGPSASPTWSSASGGNTGASKSYVATGNLSSGQTVALRADGTVQAIYAANTSNTSNGPQVVTTSAIAGRFYGSATDNSGNIVTFFWNQVAGGSAVVSTLSGTTIVSGAVNTIVAGASVESGAVCYDPTNNVFVFVYRQSADNNNYVVVGSVSGTTITLGTPVLISTSASQNNTGTSISFDSVNNKVVITYSNGAAPAGFAVVGTVSGTSITLGTPVQYAAYSTFVSSCFDQSKGKVVIFHYNNSTQVSAIVGTVSGTSISFGVAVVVDNGTASCYTAIVYDPVYKKVVFGFRDSAYYARAGVVSGTSISLETRVQLVSTASGIGVFSAAYDYAVKEAIFTFVTTTVVQARYVSVATTSAVLTSNNISFTGGDSQTRVSVVFDPLTNQSVYFFRNNATSFVNGYTNKLIYPSNNADFFGITEAAISGGASGNVTLLGGINSAQTGLSTDASYYVNTSAALTTTPTAGSAYVGIALSPTSIQIGSTTASSFDSRNVGMVLLAKTTVSGVVNVDFDDYFTSAYQNYMLVWSDVLNSSVASDLNVRLKFNGAYQSASSTYQYGTVRIGGSTYTGANTTASSFPTGSLNCPASAGTITGAGYLYLFNPLEATKNKQIAGTSVGTASPGGAGYIFTGVYTGTGGTTACQGIRLYPPQNTMSGTFALYGIVS